jgi:type II secretory pathway pseudopilin PulG
LYNFSLAPTVLPLSATMKIRFRRDAFGGIGAFTIAEAVISVVIVAIGAAGLMGAINYSFFGMRMARENLRATQIMLERTEAIRLWRWDKIAPADQTNVPPTFDEYYDPTVPTNSPSAGAHYVGRVSISDFSPYSGTTPSYATNMRELKITLQWQTGKVTRYRTNITYIAEDGIQNYVY